MSKIVSYKLVTYYDSDMFVSRVNEWIAQGYQPFGSPFQSTYNRLVAPEYCQAMVKYEEDKDE